MQGCSFLALPNSIANTGIKPFIGVYFIALVVEIPLTFLVLVIIQKAAVLRKSGRLYAKLKQLNADNSEDDDIDSDAKGSENEKKFNDTEINFHLLSESFLPWFLQIAFDALCFGLLFNAEIANALSGSQVFGHLLRIKFKNILALFVWIEVFLLIFARRLLNLVIPIASLVRCIILLIMIIICFIVGHSVHHPIHNSWQRISSPFLICLVSIGGMARIMPYLANFVPFERKNLMYLILTTALAQCSVALFNILWVYAVVSVVPQTCHDIPSTFMIQNLTTENSHCDLTLLWGKNHGEIATNPLVKILTVYYVQYKWVASVVIGCLVLSTPMSFLANGMPLITLASGINEGIWHHYLPDEPVVISEHNQQVAKNSSNKKKRNFRLCMRLSEILLQVIIFTALYLICLFCPQAFYIFANYGASLASFLYSGIFIPILFYIATSKKYDDIEIPLPVSSMFRYVASILMVFYMAMAVVAILVTVKVIPD